MCIRDRLPSLHDDLFQQPDTAGHLTANHMAQKPAEHLRVHRAQNIQRLVISQFLPEVKGDTLIQQTQSVPHSAVRRLGYIAQCLPFHLNLLRLHQLTQPGSDRVDGDPPEIIPLAAGQDRDRNLVHFGSRQYKNNIRRRFFQCLKERIKRSNRKHVNLIYNVDLVPAFRRGVGYLIHDLPDIVYTVVGRRINFDHIHAGAGPDRPAGRAFSARAALHRMFTVYCFREDLGDRRLACSTSTAEQVGVAYPFCFYLIL